jgi:hypothetical protein
MITLSYGLLFLLIIFTSVISSASTIVIMGFFVDMHDRVVTRRARLAKVNLTA